MFNIWSAFLSNATLYIPGLMLASYFSPTEAGYYSLGNNVLRLPIALIASSIGHVFSQRSAKTFHEGRLAKTVEETYKQLVIFGLFPMLVFAIIGKELFILIFGAQWAEAGIYSQILSIWTFFVFLVSPLSNLTNVLGKNEISVLINVVKLITSIGAFMIGGRLGDARLALWLFSISGVITYAGYVLWATSASGVPLRKTISIFFSNVASSSPFLLAVLLFKVFNPVPEILLTKFNLPLQNIALLLFSAVIGVGYYVTAFKRDNTLREATNEVIHKLRNRENR